MSKRQAFQKFYQADAYKPTPKKVKRKPFFDLDNLLGTEYCPSCNNEIQFKGAECGWCDGHWVTFCARGYGKDLLSIFSQAGASYQTKPARRKRGKK